MRFAPIPQLVLGFSICTLLGCEAQVPKAQVFPDVPVVLIVLDALSAEHVSHLGYQRETTPNLDALAAEGISFEAAFSPAPYTVAGIASLLTGRLPDSHGVVTKVQSLSEEETTLAELLARSSRPSLAVVSNPNGGERFGGLRGFDRVVKTYETTEQRPANYTMPGRGTQVHLPQAEESAVELRPFLDGLQGPDSPFFFYAHILQPHSPYKAPSELRNRWLDPNYKGRFEEGDNGTLIANRDKSDQLSAADIQAIRDLYDSNLLWADLGLGMILDELKRAGVFDKSLIIVTSDHGEAMFQHGRWGHNVSLFDEMVNVPLVVRFPGAQGDGLPRGMRIDDPVSTIDILPSIAEWLDLSLPGNLDGRSLAPAVAGLEQQERPAIFLRDHSVPAIIGLRTKSEKIILHPTPASGAQASSQVQFFDLNIDPDERHDLAPEGDLRVQAGRASLEKRTAEILSNRRRALIGRAAPVSFSKEESEMLSVLGYTDDDSSSEATQPAKAPD